ncbi:MAG: TetR/AcrR family transcriptional regulator [bacterium]|nr:TetR/AcrR family transcriptional regulator [bacterium]
MARTVKKASERRAEIIQAAREHFQTEDFQKLTMQNLMEKLNIAKGTIYHHFKSKEEILEAVVEEMVDEEVAHLRALLKEHQDLAPIEKLALLIAAGQMADDHEKLLENLHHPENAAIHARQLARLLLKIAPLYASVIQEGVQKGVFKTDHPLECAELLLGGIQFLTDEGFYPWEAAHILRRMNAIPSMVENLLGAPVGSFNFLNQEAP